MTTTQRTATAAIAARREFKASALHAEFVRYATADTGRMDATDDAEFTAQVQFNRTRGHDTYVVFSYGTPIAWTDHTGDLVVPATRYSVTTSKHQSIARQARDIAHSVAA